MAAPRTLRDLMRPLPPWDDVKELFGAALDATTPEERERLLADPGVDVEVLREVRSLLDAYDSAGDRFAQPALAALTGDGQPLQPTTLRLHGTRVGVYDVGRLVGEGGMGTVYEAVRADDTYKQRVAIKTIARGADSQTIARRFRRERQILAGLQHPHIAALLDGGMTDAGTPYFVMEYIEGLPIDAWCNARRLPIPQRLDLFREICSAVQHAHRRLVVHRDIKPGNVLVSDDGVAKLLDFGIARLLDAADTNGALGAATDGGLTPLTTAYASPEQARGEPVSTATDIYSLGALLYQLLAGVPPFPPGTPARELLARVAAGDPPVPPSVACTDDAARTCGLPQRERLARTLAGELDAIVLMAMRAEPERRYSSAESLADDVQRFLKRLPVVARPDTLGYRLRRFVARRRAVVAIGAAATLSGATFLGIAIWQAHAARTEADRTRRISAFLQSTLGAADASNVGGGGLRLGPNVTIGVLLDSTLQRIPTAFPDDPAIRARLYTSLGSSLQSQGRLREAAAVLDSAVRLTEGTYGTTSETYALASIEAGVVALHRNRLDDAARLIDNARASLEQRGESHSEMYARALVERSSVDLVRGDYAAIEPLANRAMALEVARTTGPSVVKAAALNRLAGVAVSRGALSSADSLLRRSLAMLDALHVPFTLERIDVLSNLSLAAWATGRIATADSFSQRGLQQATRIFGADSREAALFLRHAGLVRLAGGDTATARVQITRAVHVIDSIPEVVAPIRHLVHDGYFTYLVSVMRLADADSVAAAELSHMSGRDRGFELALAHFNYGYTRAMLHDLPTGELQLRQAETLYRSSGIVNAMADTLIRANLGAVYLREGKSADAMRYLRTLSPVLRQNITAFAAQTRGADSAAATARERRAAGR